jgi:inhibitor of KinA
MTIRFLPAGDTGLVVEFGNQIDRALSARVLGLSESLRVADIPGVIELVPTFRSLLINYDPLITSGAELEAQLQSRLAQTASSDRTSWLWHLPACYDESCAPDLVEVAERSGMSVADVVRLHSQTQFHVYMIGFVPGLPYMGDLPEPLALPRRVNPRVRVPPGSIAIATGMTIIYPVESPGGWHLIGTTPIPLFDANRAQPALLAPGDAVRFVSLTLAEYAAVSRDVMAGTYQVRHEEIVR